MRAFPLFVIAMAVLFRFGFAEEITLSDESSGETITLTETGSETKVSGNGGNMEVSVKEERKKPEVVEPGNPALKKKGYATAAGLYAGGIKPEESLKIREEIERRKKALSQPIKREPPVTRNVVFDGKKVIFLNTLRGHATVINFFDENGNFAKIEYATAGSDYFKIDKLTDHTIEIKPVDTYRGGNLIVGVNAGGRKTQVVFELTESLGNSGYDAVVNVTIRNPDPAARNADDFGYKYELVREVVRYGALEGNPPVDYEIYVLGKPCKPVLFSRDKLRIYKVEKFGRYYYVVLLHKDFVMYGFKDAFALSRYRNDYAIYVLNYNVSTFAIRTNPEYDLRRSDVERYRIVIKF